MYRSSVFCKLGLFFSFLYHLVSIILCNRLKILLVSYGVLLLALNVVSTNGDGLCRAANVCL